MSDIKAYLADRLANEPGYATILSKEQLNDKCELNIPDEMLKQTTDRKNLRYESDPNNLSPHTPRAKLDATTILREAARTIELRAKERDLPAERSMGRTVKAFNALMGTSLTETQGWLFMVILKLARETAGRHNRDDLLDAAAYAALALEAEEK